MRRKQVGEKSDENYKRTANEQLAIHGAEEEKRMAQILRRL